MQYRIQYTSEQEMSEKIIYGIHDSFNPHTALSFPLNRERFAQKNAFISIIKYFGLLKLRITPTRFFNR